MEYDIIGDVHGRADQLRALLRKLGYREKSGAFQASGREAIFLGDLIDKGRSNADALRVARAMVENGTARCVMANHEFNAVLFHSDHPDTGRPLREHSDKNTAQHQTFLDEFPIHSPHTRDFIDWMRTLPLWLEIGEGEDAFRVVHATWCDSSRDVLRPLLTADHRPAPGFFAAAAERGSPAFEAVERLLKGVEGRLRDGASFLDKSGHPRTQLRLKWWAVAADADEPARAGDVGLMAAKLLAPFADASVEIPDDIAGYPDGAPPVFLGHYALGSEVPAPLSANVACLDYLGAPGRPLTAYRHTPGAPLSADRFIQVR